jgi:hypothetical protein
MLLNIKTYFRYQNWNKSDGMFHSAQFVGSYFYIATAAAAARPRLFSFVAIVKKNSPLIAFTTTIKHEGAIFLRRIIFFYCVFRMPMDDRQSGHVCEHFSFN